MKGGEGLTEKKNQDKKKKKPFHGKKQQLQIAEKKERGGKERPVLFSTGKHFRAFSSGTRTKRRKKKVSRVQEKRGKEKERRAQ